MTFVLVVGCDVRLGESAVVGLQSPRFLTKILSSQHMNVTAHSTMFSLGDQNTLVTEDRPHCPCG